MGARSRNKRPAAGRGAGRGESRGSGGSALPAHDVANAVPSDPLTLPSGTRKPVEALERIPESAWLLVFAAWVIATASTLGALFFSEVMDLPPCVLCWYQRIFMFPLVLLLPLGLFPFDPKIIRYALPLAIVGLLVALFHLLLVAGIIPESIGPCTQGVPCAEVQVKWLGFVTIPLLSLLAFSTLSAVLIAARYRISK